MSGECGHGWGYHKDSRSPCMKCEEEEKQQQELARLRAELAEAHAQHQKHIGEIVSFDRTQIERGDEMIADLQAENRRLREALAHYANEDNWEQLHDAGGTTYHKVVWRFREHGPQIAQAALKGEK